MKFDVPVKKVKAEDARGDVLIPMADVSMLPYNQIVNVEISTIIDKRERSYEQLCLYWVLCGIVADNTDDKDWDTKEKVDFQCKFACRHIKFWTYYDNPKTGEKMLHIEMDSISFARLAHLEACHYFDQAFKLMADKIGITVDELTGEAENRGLKVKSRFERQPESLDLFE